MGVAATAASMVQSVPRTICSSGQLARQTIATGQVRTVMGKECRHDPVQRMNREMKRERGARRRERFQGLPLRHLGSAAGRTGEHQRLRDSRKGELAPQRRGRGGEGRNARRHGVGNAEPVEPAELFAHRAPDREVARVQPGDIHSRFVGGADLPDDLVEAHRRGIDDLRPRLTVGKDGAMHQRSGVEAHRTAAQQFAAPEGDQVRRARSGADEMDRHAPSPRATAQVTPPRAIRVSTSVALRPAAARAAASETAPSPVAASTLSERVAQSG